MQRSSELESELVMAPELFIALRRQLPRISRVEINVKQGRSNNELTRFRYDVVLYVGPGNPELDCQWIDWGEASLNLDSLREILRL